MLRPACAALAALAVLLAWPAFAQDDEEEADEVDYHRAGVYLGLAGTWAVEEFDNADDDDIEDSLGANARVGYRALSWLSGELMGEYVADFDVDFGPQSGNLEMLLIGANVRLNLPTDLIQPYLLFGGGWMDADLRDSSGDIGQDGSAGFARVGGGMEFYPWPSLGIDAGLSYVLPTGEIDDLSFLSINWGAIYRF